MGRTVGDVALMLDAMAGEHPGDPLSRPVPAEPFVAAVDAPRAPVRVAWSPDLGLAPIDPEVRDVCARAAARFAECGAAVEEACPDLRDAEPVFQTLRAAWFAMRAAPLLERRRDRLKPEIVWNIEQGLKLTADDIGRAERARAALYRRTAAFFRRCDVLACPTVLAPPFDCDIRYLSEVNGVRFDNYVSWLVMTFAITLTACPALSLPCGFTRDELPVGLQIVAPPRAEARVLAGAKMLEDILGLRGSTPIEPRVRAA